MSISTTLFGSKAAMAASLLTIAACGEVVMLMVVASARHVDARQAQETIRQLNGNISALQTTVSGLNGEIAKRDERIRVLSETDEQYLAAAADMLKQNHVTDAVAKLQSIQDHFPHSGLIDTEKQRLKAIFSTETSRCNDVLALSKKLDVEEAIPLLIAYTQDDHLPEFIDKVRAAIAINAKTLEAMRAERDAEKGTGVRIVSVKTEWSWVGGLGDQIFAPRVQLKFQNVSDKPVSNLETKATFVNIDTNEVFGDGTESVIGFGDTPLKQGQSKMAFLHPTIGYKTDLIAASLPRMVADISVNNHLYRRVAIAKSSDGAVLGTP